MAPGLTPRRQDIAGPVREVACFGVRGSTGTSGTVVVVVVDVVVVLMVVALVLVVPGAVGLVVFGGAAVVVERSCSCDRAEPRLDRMP